MRARSKPKTMLAGLIALTLFIPVTASIQGCTDLEPNTFGVLTPEEFFRTEREVLAAVAPIYGQLRAMLGAYHDMSQVTSDETIVPTRGSDWYDNGRWLELHRHRWTAQSPAGTADVNNAWNSSFQGVARANVVLANVQDLDLPGRDAIVAELRTLRAFYYYTLLDFFGNVPIVTDPVVDPLDPPGTSSRDEVFQFIESELIAAREDLPAVWEPGNYGRVTQSSVDALLASMYLNAEVWTGEVTTGGLQRGTARWQDAIDVVDRILNSGNHSLRSDWRANFTPDNHNNPEALFVVAHLPEGGVGFNFPMRTLHYHQLDPSPWNGFATLAETYGRFEEDDPRTDIFLVGQGYHTITGEPVNDRQGNPLVFVPEIADETQATEAEGVRVLKWPVDPGASGADHGNDYAFFRLAEMYLIKAEALNELNRHDEAVEQLNIIRRRVYGPEYVDLDAGDFTQASLRDRILDERLYELTWEARRRQDLIRHGKFSDPWFAKDQSPAHMILFPIPPQQLAANRNLIQNPGY